MAAYEFACDEHGTFEVEATIGSAPSTSLCPHCDSHARRVFSAPMVGRVGSTVRAAAEHAERSSDEPDVVTSPPPRRPAAQQYTHDPADQRLPRT